MNGDSATLIPTPAIHATREALGRRLTDALRPAWRGLLQGVGGLLIDLGQHLIYLAFGSADR